MKKSELRQLIKEEILNVLNEGANTQNVRKALDQAFKKAGIKVVKVREYKRNMLQPEAELFDYYLGGGRPEHQVHIAVTDDFARWEDVGKIVKLGKLGSSQLVSALKKNFKD